MDSRSGVVNFLLTIRSESELTFAPGDGYPEVRWRSNAAFLL